MLSHRDGACQPSPHLSLLDTECRCPASTRSYSLAENASGWAALADASTCREQEEISPASSAFLVWGLFTSALTILTRSAATDQDVAKRSTIQESADT